MARCPVQLHFGETDASIPLTDVEAIRAAQPGVEVFVYPGAGHGFGCEERGSYVPKPTPPWRRSGRWPSSPSICDVGSEPAA